MAETSTIMVVRVCPRNIRRTGDIIGMKNIGTENGGFAVITARQRSGRRK
jgi:hypothetical protein